MKEYNNIDNITNVKDFSDQLIKKAQCISKNIKSTELTNDPYYLFSQSQEYHDLNLNTQKRIEDMLTKMIQFGNSDKNFKEVGTQDRLFSDFNFLRKNVDTFLDKLSIDIEILKGNRQEDSQQDAVKELIKLRSSLNNDNNNSLRMKGQRPDFKKESNNNKSQCPEIENSYYPFVPRIKKKYNKLEELNEAIVECQKYREENPEKVTTYSYYDYKKNSEKYDFGHPYKKEIYKFYEIFCENIEKLNNVYRSIKTNKDLETPIQELVYKGSLNEESLKDLKKVIKLKSNDFEYSKIFEFEQYSDFVKADKYFDLVYIARNQKSKIRKGNDSCEKFSLSTLKEDISIENFLKSISYTSLMYTDLNDTPFLYANKPEQLTQIIDELLEEDEIAIDLEAHQRESYQGITCLMQISSRKKDYIIDCIALRSEMSELNKVFTNPQILKVLQGCDYDVLWLQRDFGLYLVNIFDTGVAASYLKFPHKSLLYLLKTICNVDANKQYQLADWRIRPIPEDMLKYAREDTHYLLYIYDYLKNQLIRKSLSNFPEDIFNSLYEVVKKSNNLSLEIYEKPQVKCNAYYNTIQKCGNLNATQMKLLKVVLKFRDYVGRVTDICPTTLFSNELAKEISKISYSDLKPEYLTQLFKLKNANSKVLFYVNLLKKILDEKYDKINKFITEKGVNFLQENFQSSINIPERPKYSNILGSLNSEVISLNQENKSPSTEEDKVLNNTNKQKLFKDFFKQSISKEGDSKSIHSNFILKEKKISLFSELKPEKNDSKIKTTINQSKFLVEKEKAVESIIEEFSKFNIISYLKTKNNINLKIKPSNNDKQKQDDEEADKLKKNLIKEEKEKKRVTFAEEATTNEVSNKNFLNNKRKKQVRDLHEINQDSRRTNIETLSTSDNDNVDTFEKDNDEIEEIQKPKYSNKTNIPSNTGIELKDKDLQNSLSFAKKLFSLDSGKQKNKDKENKKSHFKK